MKKLKKEEKKPFIQCCILGAIGGILMAAGDWLLGCVPLQKTDTGMFNRACYLSGAYALWKPALVVGMGALVVCAKYTQWCVYAYRIFSYDGERKLSKQIIDGTAEHITLPEGVKNALFRRGNAVKLDFPDESFDAVTSNYVYHNITGEDKQQLLLETLRVLKKGGTFAIHAVRMEMNCRSPLDSS